MRAPVAGRIIRRAMTTVLVLDHGELTARPPTIVERLELRLRPGALDRDLADGTVPETCGALVLRARELIGLPARRALAHDIDLILREAHASYAWTITRVPLRRAAIIRLADELERLARRLVAPEPVSARGVAAVRLLLTDGGGPLYHRGATRDLGDAVAQARSDLEVRNDSA